MKKLMMAMIGALPGGFVLLAVVMLFVGCARLQYQDPAGNVRIRGFTTQPEMAMVLSGQTEVLRANAYATRRCADNPVQCGMGMYGGGLYTPAGYTFAGITAAGVGQTSPSQNTNEMAEVKKDLGKIKQSLVLTIRAMKKGKK